MPTPSQARIAEITRAGAERAEVTVEQVVREFKLIGFSDIRKVVSWRTRTEKGKDGEPVLMPRVTIVDADKISDEAAAAVAEVWQTVNGALRVKLRDKHAALVSIGKHSACSSTACSGASRGFELSLTYKQSRPIIKAILEVLRIKLTAFPPPPPFTAPPTWGVGFVSPNGTITSHVSDKPAFAFGSAMTAFGWLRGAPQNGFNFFAQYDSGANARSWSCGTNNAGSFNTMRVVLSGNGQFGTGQTKDYSGSAGQILLDSTWHSFAMRWNSGVLDLFVDGIKDPSPTKNTDDTFASLFDPVVDLTHFCALNSAADVPAPAPSSLL
jgi:phage terminase small subunit